MVVSSMSGWAALGAAAAAAQSPPDGEGPPPEYAIHRWTSANGLPASTVQCLLQTRDGYLWIGTRNSLVRFNGKDFRTFPGINCFCLAEDSDGFLWMGGSEGLARWDGYEFKRWQRARPGFPNLQQQVLSLYPSKQGGVWVGWEAELWRAQASKLWKVPSLPPEAGPRGLFEAPNGALYLGLFDGVRILEPTRPPGPARSTVLSSAFDSRCVVESPDGVLWFGGGGAGGRIKRLRDGQVREFPESVGNLFGIAFDPLGTIWLGTDRGLWQVRDDHIVRPQGLDGESFGVVDCLLTDREGNLWVGTEDKGLYCLSYKAFHTYTVADGLVSDDIWSVTQSRDGSLWIATSRGASRLAGGRFTTFRDPTGGLFQNRLGLIGEDPSGTVWCSGQADTFVVSGRELVPPEKKGSPPVGPLSSAFGDGRGRYWFTGGHHSLFSFQNGTWTSRSIVEPGCEGLDLVGIVQDPAGDLWLGSRQDGLLQFHNGSHTRFTQKNGLTSNLVAPVLADTDGTIWIVSDEGLNRLKNGRITCYAMAQGLAEDVVFNVLEDDAGWFWLNGHRGIHRIRRQDFNDLADGKRRFLDCVTYGLEDGLLSVEGNGGRFPNSCKTTDGRLWFPTTKGLAVIDPKLTQLHSMPPPVVIESLRADGDLIYDNAPSSLTGLTPVALAGAQPEHLSLDNNPTGCCLQRTAHSAWPRRFAASSISPLTPWCALSWCGFAAGLTHGTRSGLT